MPTYAQSNPSKMTKFVVQSLPDRNAFSTMLQRKIKQKRTLPGSPGLRCRARLVALGVQLIFLLSSAIVYSQALLFEQYTIKDGLPSNWVTFITQDSKGHLWIGADGGIAVYDGVEFKRYGSREGLLVPHVWAIIESKKYPGTFYIGTHGGGLTVFRDGAFTTRSIGTNFAHKVVGHLLEDSFGRLWCGTNGGLFTLEEDSLVAFELPGMENRWVGFIEQTKDSLIWISYDNQVYRYDTENARLESLNPVLSDSVYSLCLQEDDDGTIWIGTDSGEIHKIKNDRLIATKKLQGLFAREILDDREGNLWITTVDGPALLNKASFPDSEPVLFNNINGMLHEDVSPGFVDRENNLWFGTPRSGLYKLSDRNVIVFPFQNISASQPNAVMIDENQHLFTASDNGIWEIWRARDGSWRKHLHSSAALQIDAPVYSIEPDQNGRLWLAVGAESVVGYQRQMQQYGATGLTLAHRLQAEVDLHTGGRFGGFMVDRNNQLWYRRTAGLGLAQYDLNAMQRVKVYTRDDGLAGGTVSASLMDRDGKMWFGEFNGGIAVFKPDGKQYVHERTFTSDDGLAGNQVRSMVQRQNGEIWIGHRYDGISIFKEGTFENVREKDGLINDAVWSLAEDDQQRVWLGTSAGIQHTALDDERNFVTDKRLIRTTTRVLGQIPGMPMMYMMNVDDLTLYKPPAQEMKKLAVPIEITALRVSGKEADLQSELQFQSDENLFEIEFLGISLKDEKLLRFQYSLSARSNEWSGTTQQRSLQFTSLRPGDYHFKVKAVTAEGVESPEPAELRFTVLPPLWQRWWFILFAFILIGALLYAIHQVQLQRALAVERIRSRISTDLHDDIGAGLTHIGLLSDVALRKTELQDEKNDAFKNKEMIQELAGSIERVGHIARELSNAMSDVVWSINPKHDSVEALIHRLSGFAYDVCEAKDIKLDMQVSRNIMHVRLDPEIRRNLLLVAKEAIHNAAKYSESSLVQVQLSLKNDEIWLEIVDQGKGFDLTSAREGNGLQNIRSRIEKLGGHCDISSQAGQGTRIFAVVRLKR